MGFFIGIGVLVVGFLWITEPVGHFYTTTYSTGATIRELMPSEKCKQTADYYQGLLQSWGLHGTKLSCVSARRYQVAVYSAVGAIDDFGLWLERRLREEGISGD